MFLTQQSQLGRSLARTLSRPASEIFMPQDSLYLKRGGKQP